MTLPLVRVLVTNLADNASTNIRDRLLEQSQWHASHDSFRGHVVRDHATLGARLIEVDGPTVMDEALTEDLAATGWPIEAVWFLSRHRAASGDPSLTVHPVGNPTHRHDYGGQPRTFGTCAPRDMGALLRRLAVHRDRLDLPHEVTYEATHHGPYIRQPSLFVEIGSNEDWYDDEPSAKALAAAVLDVLGGEGTIDGPVHVGVGGGHYVPQQTRKALAGEADFGHMIASYAVDPDDDGLAAMIRDAQAATPGCDGVYVHKKGLKGPQRQAVRDLDVAM